MAKTIQPFDPDTFLRSFKAEMTGAIDRIFGSIEPLDTEDDEWSDREEPTDTSGLAGRTCIFQVAVDQRALAGMSKSKAKDFLASECVDVMLDAYEKAAKLAKAIRKTDQGASRGGYADCGAKVDHGGRVSGECRVGISW